MNVNMALNIYTGLPFSIIILRKYVAALSCAHLKCNATVIAAAEYTVTYRSTIRLFDFSDGTIIKVWKACT